MTCKDCIHNELCGTFTRPCYPDEANASERLCQDFKNKADFVEVVRCKDCKHEYTDSFGQMWCRLHRKHEGERLVEENHFCSYGEPVNYGSSKNAR